VRAQPKVELELLAPAGCIVTLRGEHDSSTMSEIALVMNLASAHRYVLVDLSECSFLDSSVVDALLQAAELARERTGALELVAGTKDTNPVRRALEVMGVGEVVRLHALRATGIASLDAMVSAHPASQSLRASVRNGNVEEARVASGWSGPPVALERPSRQAPEERERHQA
jgi:anti-anti-sigma factor